MKQVEVVLTPKFLTPMGNNLINFSRNTIFVVSCTISRKYNP